jgi:hypothetical protein
VMQGIWHHQSMFCVWLNGDPRGSGLEWILHIPLYVVRGDWIGQSFGWDWKNWGPVSQQVWYDKDSSLPWAASIGLNFTALHR